MKTISVTALFFLVTIVSATGQSSPGTEKSIHIGAAIGNAEGTASAAYVYNWLLGKNHRIMVGVGGRFTAYLGRNKNYVTAPAKLTSNSTGPLVIFKPNIVANMDTFLIARPNVYAINATISLGYRFNERLYAAFNIDALGFSFGGKRQGDYINGSLRQRSGSHVTNFNALLVSDNDLGTLNSELFVNYALNDKWSLRAGAQFLFTEYTTDSNVQLFPEANDRFRKKSLMFMMGTSFRL
jgi:hypothetical protein